MRARSAGSIGGFTLLEAVISIALSTLLAVLVSAAAIEGVRSMRGVREAERVHANAIALVGALSYWGRQATRLDVPQPETLHMLLPGGALRTVTLAGDAVTLDGRAVTTSDVAVSELAFTRAARSVRVSFTISGKESGAALEGTTAIARRN
jgi:hypothetical protein